MVRCPGQDQRFWKPGDVFEVQCPNCRQAVEFFKDEPKLKCHKCGQTVNNPKIDLGCTQWCQYAEQCLPISAAPQTSAIRDKLVDEMKKVFTGNEKQIQHMLAVLDYAEQIQAVEGGDPLVVRAAAILLDTGPVKAHNADACSSDTFQALEGSLLAREILARYGVDGARAEHVCRILASRHRVNNIDTIEFRIVCDADNMVNLKKHFENVTGNKQRQIIDRVFKTTRGQEIAVESFLEPKAKTN